jgi:peptidoglycan/LPS O-acetylase OafA/YrhL
LAYRPDIDGLRAIAVLAVLFFHTRVPGFGGGFVGVDLFFVISGFLITSILLKDFDEGNYSIARFYERRIRRIFPALFPVIAFTIIVGALLLDPKSYKDFSDSILGTTLFYSNFVFANQSGYFDSPSLQKPLLHTWSLSVEEQFYILFPLLLFFINRKLKSRYALWLILVAVGSMAASIYGVSQNQPKTFYLVHARAWELLAGSFLALRVLPATSSVLLRRLLSVAGFALILYSIIFYDESTSFPGAHAIVPVLGAAIIIYSGMGEDLHAANRLLTFRPLVFVGLISYSLYLWHWPLVAFYEYVLYRPMNMLDSAVIIAASFGMAILSWRYIEQPFRGSSILLRDRKKLFMLSGVMMIVTSMVAVIIYREEGMPYRYFKMNTTVVVPEISEEVVTVIDGVKIGRIGASNVDPSFILWGDSHAGHLVQGLGEKGLEYGVSGYTATSPTNIPLIGVNSCVFNDKVISFIQSHPKIRTVILAGIWGAYSNGHRYGEYQKMELKDAMSSAPSQTSKSVMYDGFMRTVNKLHGLGCKVVIVDDIPEIGYNAPRLYMVKAVLFREDINKYVPDRSRYKEWNKRYEDIVRALDSLEYVKVVHPEEMLFDKNGHAMLIAENVILYHDADHLSRYGSHFVAPAFNEVFGEMSATR